MLRMKKNSEKSKESDHLEPLLPHTNGHSTSKQKPSSSSLTLLDDFDDETQFSAYQPPKMSQDDDEKETAEKTQVAASSTLTSSNNPAAFFAVAPIQPSKEIKHDIPDELLYHYIRDESFKVIDKLLADRLDDTACCIYFNKCTEPKEVDRARELKLLLTFYDEKYEIADTVIDFIKTGEVKRDYVFKIEDKIKTKVKAKVKSYGESSFDSQSLRGMFINRFIPYYTNYRGTDWFRAAQIRQGTWINDGYHNLDEVVLLDLARKEVDAKLTRLETQRTELKEKLPKYAHSSQELAMQEELRRLEQQLHELMPEQYAKPTMTMI